MYLSNLYKLAQDKWVTFEDLVDDAMEGGKLSPMHMRSGALNAALRHPRRYSVTGNTDLGLFRNQLKYQAKHPLISKSTSMSSNSSCVSDSNLFGSSVHIDPPPSKCHTQRRFMHNSYKLTDFSQTFPGISGNFSKLRASDIESTKSNNTDPIRLEGAGESKIKNHTSSDVEDSIHVRRSTAIPLGTPSESFEVQNSSFVINLKSARTTQLARESQEKVLNDKYQALTNLRVNQEHGYTGWSTSVMGTGPFGWSDDLLNVYTPSTVS